MALVTCVPLALAFNLLYFADASVMMPTMNEFEVLMTLLNSTRTELKDTKDQLARALVAIDGLSHKLSDRKYWNSLDSPIRLGTLNWNNPGEILSFTLPIGGNFIPMDCKEVLVNVVLRSGNEAPSGWYHVDLWTLTGDDHKNLKRIRGVHNPQNALSFNSENMWFPVETGSSKLYYRVEDFPTENYRHKGELVVMGWR